MTRPRIAIRSFTCRRDIASALLLARLLEKQGCEAMVCCVRNFHRTLRLWKPEVAVVNTAAGAQPIKPLWPAMKVVFLDGEGMVPDINSLAGFYRKHEEAWSLPDKILLWGEKTRSEVLNAIPSLSLSKVGVVGNPRLDLVRYLPKRCILGCQSDSVGVVARFRSINDHDGRSTLQYLPNPGNLDDTIAQATNFVGLIKAVRLLLQKTDLHFEIRPHPLEQIESYKIYRAKWFGDQAHRVTIDNSLSFAHFCSRQRALLSPTSTAFLKAYLLRVPVINMDVLCKSSFHNLEAEIGSEWRSAALQPSSYDELIEILQRPLPPVARVEKIELQLNDYCDYSNPESACLRSAREIAKVAHTASRPRGVRLPTAALKAMDEISFRRSMRRNPYHQNMNYKEGYHPEPEYLDEIVETVLNSQSRDLS